MAFFEPDEIKQILTESVQDAKEWRREYPELERIANNELPEDLDEYEPETSDGSLAAALHKLPKRVINKDLQGRVIDIGKSDNGLTVLANYVWEDIIIPNANTQLPFARKWKDAVRKSAIYGGQPIITLFVEKKDGYTGSDIIIPQAQDVTLEAGKVSDLDSDIIFWDIYYSKKQLKDMIEQAEKEKREGDEYNKWDIKALKEILAAGMEEDRASDIESSERLNKAVKKSGYKFCVAFQRGVKAPFYMYHSGTDKVVKTWPNPDPTGDVPVHYLYCYQDLINPYGIGIVKLAGGTQNVLDFMRRADVLATQVGIKPPKLIEGPADEVDEDSLVYAQDANWFVGNAKVTRLELANGVYAQLPNRISMYKTSLNQLIPTGDTSISATAGDPKYSKTPAGVKFQAANLSIDDDDYRDNVDMTYEAVAKSMINTHFANMDGKDVINLPEEVKEAMISAGMEAEKEFLMEWDKYRSTFDFKMDAEDTTAKDKEQRVEALLKILELRGTDETMEDALIRAGVKLDVGELFKTIITLVADNENILRELNESDKREIFAAAEEEQAREDALNAQRPPAQVQINNGITNGGMSSADDPAQIKAIIEGFGVDEGTARAMLAGIDEGYSPEEIFAKLGEDNGQR